MLLRIIGVIFASVVLIYASVYTYDRPGGLSDWRMSQNMGMAGTIHIPLGETPEDAIQQFRNFMGMEVIHREPVDSGMLLFFKKNNQEENINLQVEYARKTWLGWKWGWGGGYSISKSLQADSALNYMIMPREKGLSTPFPLVFGYVLNSSIQSITVEVKGRVEGEGESQSEYHAKLTKGDIGQTIWFVSLPSSTSMPFDIKGFDEKGELLAEKTITDPRDSGSVEFRN
ncbi:MAG: hypothetical protein K6T94_18360 [Paenibacillus sp.]|nr:hypothetical protein [Paenibacillus sp.]